MVTSLFTSMGWAIDSNSNSQSDVWEMVFGVSGLAGAGDADGDGWSNARESAGGTDPFDAADRPGLSVVALPGGEMQLVWKGLAGKRYTIGTRDDPGPGAWDVFGGPYAGTGTAMGLGFVDGGDDSGFFNLLISDADTDTDGVFDWEELAVGFDPTRNRTDRSSQLDLARVTAGMTSANYITVAVYDERTAERWPDPAVFAVRRQGGLQPITVNIALGGSATLGDDFRVSPTGSQVAFGPGVREVFISVTPLEDADSSEADETVSLTVLGGTGYTVGPTPSGEVIIEDYTTMPTAKEAARFLIQATYGPDQDSIGDADQIPESVESVRTLGFEGWLEDQFDRPVGTLSEFVAWGKDQDQDPLEIYNDNKQNAWWGRAMELPELAPGGTVQASDPLRQRVAFELSQIFVISDRMEDLGVNPLGMANFYDMLLGNAFGNFRDLLFDVALHPCMGMYLSHLGNRKPDPANNVFPDENFAREIMQLFSIGLWQLNPDGSRVLDEDDLPIPTYNNTNITEFARVFTGLAFGGPDSVNFGLWPRSFVTPMAGWDEYHDCDPKTLLNGTVLPERDESPDRDGLATMADLNGAIDNLFEHPNVGPFIGRQLIQRLVTSNPTPEYIARVSAAFADNGDGVRGDMEAVISAILLDPEARDLAMLSDPTYGKLREPFLKCVSFARAFHATSQEGWYYLDAFTLDHVQEPLKSPSVFNFYLPTYSPPGSLSQSGLVAPEFQIVNASSGVTSANYFYNAILGGLHRWGTASDRPERAVRLDLAPERALNVTIQSGSTVALPVEPLVRRLDLVLTGGNMEPRNFQLVCEAMRRVDSSTGSGWPDNRLRLGIYLILQSADFAVQR